MDQNVPHYVYRALDNLYDQHARRAGGTVVPDDTPHPQPPNPHGLR